MTTLEWARAYIANGFCVIPVLADGSKKPATAWKAYQSRMPNDGELERWFGYDTSHGIAVICGRISGGLEVIDFESQQVHWQWEEIMKRDYPELLDRLPRVRTPSLGVHVYLRSANPAGNTKLAILAAGETLVETRGEGGYVLAPGSPAECHPDHDLYHQFAGPDLLGGFQ